MFCHFWQKFENSKWPPLLKNLPKVNIACCSDTLGVENFDEITLSLTVKDIEGILCFATFGKNSKIKVNIACCLDTLGVENFDEITLSLTVKEIEAILWFATFGKNSKIENGPHF